MLAVGNKTKHTIPLALFQKASDLVLGKKYDLSLVICGDTLTRKLNIKHRSKNKPANVLSFPLSKTSGEMFLNPSRAKKEAAQYDRSAKNHLIALYIHGLLHLAGYDHGQKMDTKEIAVKRTLKLSYS